MEYEDEQHKSHPPKTKKRNANHTELVSVDSTTSTDWVDRYGRDGYFLFDHQGNAAQQNTLPDYVEKIVWKNEGTGAPRLGNWPLDGHGPLPILATQNPMACYQTYCLDILAQPEKVYQFTLRTAELGTNGKFVIDLFDERTKNLIHPTILVKTTGNVRYYTFRTRGPVRVRLSHVAGEDAGLSGIFFQ